VYVLKGAALERVDVQLGASDGRRTEITGEGVDPGSQVVIDIAEAEKG
jgi:multidrug efflux pump subunit AcrA (membrane-fusion protein)